MGMFDSFLDKVAECPKCHSKVTEWQTKMLQSLGDFWEKGDFVQYRQLDGVAEKKQRKKDDDTLLPLFRRDREYLSDAPFSSMARSLSTLAVRNATRGWRVMRMFSTADLLASWRSRPA